MNCHSENTVYYNDTDAYAAAWLRNLISAGEIPQGDVDERSICDVQSSDLAGYTQCHFFCGIAGWPLALKRAGWPADRPVWSGSCPCQPFSCAGQGKGQADNRHLWPEFSRLIRECRPPVVLGEQVSSAIGHGWLDGVFADLETEGYACGAIVYGAHSAGAPHQRQRLYWCASDNAVADPGSAGLAGRPEQSARAECAPAERSGDPGPLADADQSEFCGQPSGCGMLAMGDPARGGCGIVGDAALAGRGGHALGSEWARFGIVHCRDGKARRFGPGSFPLASGIPRQLGPLRARLAELGIDARAASKNQVGRLKGYGNAICMPDTIEFIRAVMEAKP